MSLDVVLGVDPGYAALGLAVVVRGDRGLLTLLWGRTLRPEGMWGKRAHRIGEALAFAVETYQPSVLALEDQVQAQVAQAKRGHFRHSNLSVNRVSGYVIGRCPGLLLVEVPPSTWKKSLGLPARASKEQVRSAVLAQVDGIPARVSEHLCDAIGIAVCGLRRASATSGSVVSRCRSVTSCAR